MKKKWRNSFRALMIAPAPALFPTEQDKCEADEQALHRQPDGMPAPLDLADEDSAPHADAEFPDEPERLSDAD